MTVVIKAITDKSDLRKFIYLPAEIHKDHKNWLPPIYLDEWEFFTPSKNKSFSYCDTVLALAYREGKVVGRIMGIINRKYNDLRNEKHARFGYLECWDDPEVSHALLNYVEDWARVKGMHRIIGPYGFSDKDPQGLLIEGFEFTPLISAPCNQKFLVGLVEDEGYEKEVDCLMFRADLTKQVPEFYNKIFNRVNSNSEYKLLEFTRKRDLKPYILPILQLLNESYAHIYGFSPLEEQEMKDFAKRYMPVLDPRFVKAIIHAGQVVAFIIGLPNMSPGIQRSKGRLTPLGLFYIWLSSKSTKQLDLMLGGVKPDHQGRGLEVLMGLKLFDSAKQAQYTSVEVHLVLETNAPMLAQMSKLGALPHKRFRVFQKNLRDN